MSPNTYLGACLAAFICGVLVTLLVLGQCHP